MCLIYEDLRIWLPLFIDHFLTEDLNLNQGNNLFGFDVMKSAPEVSFAEVIELKPPPALQLADLNPHLRGLNVTRSLGDLDAHLECGIVSQPEVNLGMT